MELAKLAGVSDATVSLVLAGKDKGRASNDLPQSRGGYGVSVIPEEFQGRLGQGYRRTRLLSPVANRAASPEVVAGGGNNQWR